MAYKFSQPDPDMKRNKSQKPKVRELPLIKVKLNMYKALLKAADDKDVGIPALVRIALKHYLSDTPTTDHVESESESEREEGTLKPTDTNKFGYTYAQSINTALKKWEDGDENWTFDPSKSLAGLAKMNGLSLSEFKSVMSPKQKERYKDLIDRELK